jgi:uracil-DNA glycosylase
VALGATAILSITGRAMPVQKNRGVIIPSSEWPIDGKRAPVGYGGNQRLDLLVTVHLSFLLRLQTEEDKRREWRAFLDDLWLAGKHAAKRAAEEG